MLTVQVFTRTIEHVRNKEIVCLLRRLRSASHASCDETQALRTPAAAAAAAAPQAVPPMIIRGEPNSRLPGTSLMRGEHSDRPRTLSTLGTLSEPIPRGFMFLLRRRDF